MALKTTWNHNDVSNRSITESLYVKYTTDQVYYDVAPKGDGSPPSYVTSAETALDAAADALEDAQEALDAMEMPLAGAKALMDTAYSTWYANQTLQNYQNYALKRSAYNTVRSQYASQEATVNAANMNVAAKTKLLNAANERWAQESETVEYKGGRFLGFEYHRKATMRMTYFGFNLAAATSCKAYFDALYTRTITKSASFNNGVIEYLTQTANPSTVRLQQEKGDNYKVEIEVTEDDVKLSTTLVDPSTLFTAENARVYL